MKRQVRRGVYETNSSSCHAISMCSGEEYEKWKNGELVFDRELEALIPVTEKDEDSPEEYLSQDEYYEEMGADFETFHASYELPDGQEVVAFGYYGYDG